jgi:myo-inositol-1(or 4)-monophosphatase
LPDAETIPAKAREPAGRASDLDLLLSAGAEAAKLALGFHRKSPQVWSKEGGSPVSEADIAVDRLLAERLRGARPDYGWLSEETADDSARLNAKRLFVVDPIDGTRNFIEGGDEWTVALAVVEAGRPVTAVLIAPALDVVLAASLGSGATRNGRKIGGAGVATGPALRFSGPRGVSRRIAATSQGGNMSFRFVPSLAYRLALIATGELDIAVAGPDAHDWDLAAADLLVHEAGGRVADFEGRAVLYNRPEPRHPSLIAAAPGLFSTVAAALNEAG